MDNDIKLLQMYDSANKFKECALRVLGNRNENGSINIIENSRLLTVTIPSVVNISLTCELYLKMLIFNNENIVPHTHEIKDLYDRLTAKQKKNLIKMLNIPQNELEKLLKKYSNLFVQYRYYFDYEELPSVDYLFILNLAEFLNAMCSEIQKDIVNNSHAGEQYLKAHKKRIINKNQ